MYYYMGEVLLVIGLVISTIAQLYVKYNFSKYLKVKTKKSLTGFDVAKLILEKNGLSDIYITEIKNTLGDHYDSSRKVIRLSTEVYHGDSIASVSVAAHEVGHAIQDKENYNFMRFREKLFPLVKFSSYGGYFSILIGMILGFYDLIWFGIGLEIVILIFQIITLPVEFNASERAKKELLELTLIDNDEVVGSSKMLKSAALTYVASVVTTILQILRLILMFSRHDD